MKKTITEEIQYLGQMLTATTSKDKKRIKSIIKTLEELYGRIEKGRRKIVSRNALRRAAKNESYQM